MGSSIESSLRRRMLATVVLFVVCAMSFVGTLAVLYGYVVPEMLAWWGRRFDLRSEIGVIAMLVPAGVVLWLAVGTVKNFYASPLSATKAQDATEDEYPELYASVRRLAQQADVPAPALKIVPTRVPNAFTVGITPNTSTIVVSTGLLETLEDDELHAVLAHEIAHITNRDGAVMSIGYLLPAVAYAFAKALTSPFDGDDSPIWSQDSDASTRDPNEGVPGSVGQSNDTWASGSITLLGRNSTYAASSTNSSPLSGSSSDDSGDGGGGILVAILVLVAITIVTAVLTLAISTFFWVFSSLTLVLLARTREYAADWGAVELTGEPEALASALAKLDDEIAQAPLRDLRQVDGAVETLYVMPLRRGLHAFSDVLLLSDDLFPNTHPDTQDRIDRILELRKRQ